MSVIHTAYRFDSTAFLEELTFRCLQNELFNEQELLRWAKESVAKATKDALCALQGVRFDEEWLSCDNENEKDPRLWLLIVLISFLEKSPSLSNRSGSSYYVLMSLMKTQTQLEANLHKLVFGDGLDSLVKKPGKPALNKTFIPMPKCCGWLNREQISAISSWLFQQDHLFLSLGSDDNLLLKEHSDTTQLPVSELLALAYEDIREMLSSASAYNRDLLFILEQ